MVRCGYRGLVGQGQVPAGAGAGGLSVSGSWATFAAIGASTFASAFQHKELRQKQAKMSHSAPKYSCKREGQRCELALLTLKPQQGVWHGLASAARPEKSHSVGKAGAWKGIAAKRPFL